MGRGIIGSFNPVLTASNHFPFKNDNSPHGHITARGSRSRFFKGQSIAEVAQSCTDGAIARYYTAREWKEMVSPYLEVEQTRIYGQKNELIPLPACGLKTMIENMLPAALGRFVTNTLRQGSFLVVTHRKAS